MNDQQLKSLNQDGKPLLKAVDDLLYFRVVESGRSHWCVRYKLSGQKRSQINIGRYGKGECRLSISEARTVRVGRGLRTFKQFKPQQLLARNGYNATSKTLFMARPTCSLCSTLMSGLKEIFIVDDISWRVFGHIEGE